MICFFSNKPSDAGIFSGEAWGSFVSSFWLFQILHFLRLLQLGIVDILSCHEPCHEPCHLHPRPLLSVTFHLHHLLLLPAETWWRRPVAAVECLPNQVRIYVKGMTKHTIFLHYFFACGLFKPAKKHWGPSEKQGILLILPCEIVIFGRRWSSETIFFSRLEMVFYISFCAHRPAGGI